MSAEPKHQVLRLRKKHAPGSHEKPVARDGERLVRAQSLRQAIMAGIIVIVVFAVIWSMLTATVGRIFPWMTMLLGALVGFAVRRAGQGLDWRFPATAAVLAFVGSLFAKLVIAAGTTAGEFDVSTIAVLSSVTTMTWPIFFAEAMTQADWAYAIFAAGIAAFLAGRRLSRREYQALRIWQEKEGSE
jgi:hypothetical protein